MTETIEGTVYQLLISCRFVVCAHPEITIAMYNENEHWLHVEMQMVATYHRT